MSRLPSTWRPSLPNEGSLRLHIPSHCGNSQPSKRCIELHAPSAKDFREFVKIRKTEKVRRQRYFSARLGLNQSSTYTCYLSANLCVALISLGGCHVVHAPLCSGGCMFRTRAVSWMRQRQRDRKTYAATHGGFHQLIFEWHLHLFRGGLRQRGNLHHGRIVCGLRLQPGLDFLWHG